MTSTTSELADFGWNDFFASQLEPGDQGIAIPARVMAVHRDRIHVAGPGIDALVAPFTGRAGDDESAATVGDWLLLDAEALRPRRLLERSSLFKRRAAGTRRRLQLIAANVDALLIVSSCNQDFNAARLERYLALAGEAGVTPVIVLTKADLADAPEDYVDVAARLAPDVLVEVVDARDPDSVARLAPWCAHGRTVALVGSSGVGKSTLINTLTGTDRIATQGAREDDDKGRHTTSGRSLHRLPSGGWLVDTPGIRELQITDVKAGIDEVFDDIVALAQTCRFADCRHESEPGCAVLAAIASGQLEAERVRRWRKLAAEEAHNTTSLAERRTRDRAFGKTVKRAVKDKRSRREE
jgi:ribosome biogenesis GTPase / thiamine phosphate phosphatase